jgi:hypothetical protein
MKDVVNPTTGSRPSYYSKQIAFSKLEVDIVGNFTVFFLYAPGKNQFSSFVSAVVIVHASLIRSNEIRDDIRSSVVG